MIRPRVTLWSVVDDEARHDWLDVQRELARDEQPEPSEYRDLATVSGYVNASKQWLAAVGYGRAMSDTPEPTPDEPDEPDEPAQPDPPA